MYTTCQVYLDCLGLLDRVNQVARMHLLYIPSPKMLKEVEATVYCI